MCNMDIGKLKSRVEQLHIARTESHLCYGDEKLPVIVTGNYPELGRLTALRFLEWVQSNPEGVVALPTGKTPEFFIHHVQRYINALVDSTSQAEVLAELEAGGVEPGKEIDLRGLQFVQIDEFYPINPSHANSFYHYVNKYYLDGFGISREKAQLINCEEIGIPEGMDLERTWEEGSVDLSLRNRRAVGRREQMQQDVIRRVDQWCVEYEERIRAKGGIGFFLGGIGPDGHIGFNVRGSDLFSTTRLTDVNYETQAAAAGDLGGIEVARSSKVITIGLSTITYNPQTVAIVMAAGEAKARIVADAITSEPQIIYPATALQKVSDGRFYITEGAAKFLDSRQIARLEPQDVLNEKTTEKIVIDTALQHRKRITDLNRSDYQASPWGALLLRKSRSNIEVINRQVSDSLKQKIEAGVHPRKEATFLHTEPHHDDIMLGYLPYVVRHIREHSTTHHFATLTSGFTSVTNKFMLGKLLKMQKALSQGLFATLLEEDYFDPDNKLARNRDVWKYLDGVASRSQSDMDEGMLRRLLRDLITVFEDSDIENLQDRVDELVNYFQTQYPGKKDLPHIQKLKGMCREWESACLWGYFGWNSEFIEHLRLGFYKGDTFTEDPTISRDVLPVKQLIDRLQPDVVTVAFDPEGSGPDTHYKVLQAVAAALEMHRKETDRQDIQVIGYRNVWYRYHPSEINMCVPVSLNMMTLQHGSFMSTYASQRDASFPSSEYDGPFSKLAQSIQVEQYEMLKTCLGREYFYEHPSALIRATRGFVFLKQMDLSEFFRFSRELARKTEDRSN
ncbi:MAG: hypothetical protein K9L57_10195 [Spirochaetaceae bacterium]|nr:glucosamine-6-phosphate deaminase [Spirochaetia bacterium]MCF7951993.1 hypothetical protein [Spirochaetaceae bacterium]